MRRHGLSQKVRVGIVARDRFQGEALAADCEPFASATEIFANLGVLREWPDLMAFGLLLIDVAQDVEGKLRFIEQMQGRSAARIMMVMPRDDQALRLRGLGLGASGYFTDATIQEDRRAAIADVLTLNRANQNAKDGVPPAHDRAGRLARRLAR